MKKPEMNIPVLGCRKHFYWYIDKAEADGTFPHGMHFTVLALLLMYLKAIVVF